MDKFYILSEIGGWGVWPSEVQAFLNANRGKDVEIVINSPGGYIDDGMAIYNLLRNHTGKVHTTAISQAASMGSIIFMAGDVRKVETGAYIMIHKPGLQYVSGDANDMRAAAEYLDTMQDALLEVYVERSGKSKEEIEPLVDAETWLLGEAAVELGLATEVSTVEYNAVACSVKHNLNGFNNTPTALRKPEPTPEATKTAAGVDILEKKDKAANTADIGQAEAPAEHNNTIQEEKSMEIVKATAADVQRENPELYGALVSAGKEAEQNRVGALVKLGEATKTAPAAVQDAAKKSIDLLVQDPNATAENSAGKVIAAISEAQAAVVNTVGSEARALGETAEDLEAAADEEQAEETETKTAEARKTGLAAGFKKA